MALLLEFGLGLVTCNYASFTVIAYLFLFVCFKTFMYRRK